MTDRALLNRLRRGEDETTEFIANVKLTETIAKSVCAFLNSGGGTIFCGVRDDGTVVGLPEPAEDVAQAIEAAIVDLITPTSLFTVTVEDIKDQAIAIVEVPVGQDKPYVLNGAVFVRSGSRTRPASAEALRAMLNEQIEAPERWERRLSPSMTIDDLDLSEVRQMANIASTSEGLTFDPDEEPTEVLRRLSLWRPDGFTHAGDVLFSKNPGARHPQCKVQLIRYTSDKVDDEYEDYRWFDGPLVRIASEVFDNLGAINPSRARFTDQDLERVDQTVYSMAALREALVNAMVHRDYSAYSGGVKVSVYSSRIEFWNSGRLPDEISLGDLRKDHPSIPTNPDIAQVFRLRGLMERTGRGTLKIIKACSDLGAPPPRWRNHTSGVTLTLFAATPAASLQFELNARQRAFVDGTNAGDTVSPSDYHANYASDVSTRQARRDLTELEEFGYVRRVGGGPSTAYKRLEA